MIDFNGLQTLVIPEGEVAIIMRGSEILWEKQTSRLPKEYQEVSYIQSTGKQYIKTPILNNATDTIVLQLDLSYDTIVQPNQLMGFTGNNGNSVGITSNRWFEVSSLPPVTVGTRYLIEYGVSGNQIYRTVNGVTVSNTRSPYDYTSNLMLFAVLAARGTTTVSNYCRCKLYSAKVAVNGDVVADYVPCYRKSDGKSGLYDLVTKTFLVSDGTADFVLGE